jgi:hypothetical protein
VFDFDLLELPKVGLQMFLFGWCSFALPCELRVTTTAFSISV